MINLLRLFVIIVTALVVFGWAVTAGQTIPVLPDKDVSWDSVQGIRLQELPQIPGRKVDWPKPADDRFEIGPDDSKPDFGSLPKLALLPVAPERKIVDEGLSELPLIAANDVGFRIFGSLFADEPATVIPFNRIAGESRLVAAPAAGFKDIGQATATAAAIDKEPSKPVSLQPRRVTLDIEVLAQRVEAHNFSVAGIEDQLRSQDSWNLASIESAYSQIEAVRNDHELWALYWNILKPIKKRRLGTVMTLDQSLESLRQRIFETLVEVDVDPEAVTSLGATHAKQRLAEIDRNIRDWMSSDR